MSAAGSSFDVRRVWGGAVALGAGEIVARAVALIGTTFVARMLGPEGYGVVGFASAVCGYFTLAVSAGFNEIGARDIALEPAKARSIAASALLGRLLFATLAFGGLLGVVALMDKSRAVTLVVALTGATLFSTALDTTFVFRGLERTRRVGVALVLSQVTYVAILLATVRSPADALFVPIAQFSGELVSAAWLGLALLAGPRVKPSLRAGLHLVSRSRFVVLTRVLRTLLYTFDVVLIGLLLGERAVGLYAAPYRFCYLLVAISSAIQVAHLPPATRARRESPSALARVLGEELALTALVGAPLLVGGIVGAGGLLELFFGNPYGQSADALRLLLVSVGFIFGHGLVHNALLASGKSHAETATMLTATAVNVAANVFVIPRYGIEGAAATTALAEGVAFVLGVYLVRRFASVSLLSLGPLLAPFVGGLGMAAVMLWLRGQPVLVQLALGTLAYAVVTAMIRRFLGRAPAA